MEVNIYIGVDSTAPKKSEKMFGYVIECTIKNELRTRMGFGSVTGTYHQATLEAIASALARFNKPSEISIFTEDSFIIDMIHRNLQTWQANNFVTSKGKPVKHKEEWMKYWELSRIHTIQGTAGRHSYSGWLHRTMEEKKHV